jgi:hypothetical protein
MMKRLLLLMLMSIIGLSAIAQVTKIRGKVLDALTGEPLPFVNVFLTGSTIGTTTDFEGGYYFETKARADSIAASFIGYKKQVLPIRLNRYQEINFSLAKDEFILDEVVVVAGENPADVIMRKVIENKSKNSKKELKAIQYEAYNKIQFDANNFEKYLSDKKFFKEFEFVFDFVDTSTVNGKAYLPVFISESLSEIFIHQNPDSKIERIIAVRGSGIENPSIAQFMGNLYQEVNIYDNYIKLLGKNFVSPIADFSVAYYRYYLVDSAFYDNEKSYKLMLKPRRKQELTFTGSLWIHDSTFAVQELEINIAADANLNFVSDLTIRQEFERIDNEFWFLTKDFLIADFTIAQNNERLPGFFGQRTTTYRNFVLNEPKDPKFYRQPLKLIIDESSMEKTMDFWQKNRHLELTQKEEGVYAMIDSVENVPIFKTYADAIYTFVYGYLPHGKIEWGPLNKIISFNSVEGHRFRAGGRTTTLFSKNLRLDGHIAYGTRDQQIKYGAGLHYMLGKNPRRAAGINFKYDTEQLGSSFNAFSEDNLIGSLFRRQPADKLNLTGEFRVFYDHEWIPGISNRIELLHRELFPLGDFRVVTYNNSGEPVDHRSIITSEIALEGRFAFQEKIVVRDFERISLGTPFPVFNFRYSVGVPDMMNGEYHYHRIQAGVTHWFNIGSFGWSKYILEGGRVFGTLPFPLLVLHPGNETFIFDEYAFNLMNYYEFISDRYFSLYYTHHFDGFFFNRIPLMRKLKWREVFFVKGLVGTISDANLEFNELPKATFMLDKPYFEAGIGIENIFKIIRVDGIWRLSHRDNSGASPFAVFVTLQFAF